MKTLKDFVEDFVGTTPIYSTPLNTPGMGNISISQVGSDGISTDPICGAEKPTKKLKKKHAKSLSSLIKEQENEKFLDRVFGLKQHDHYNDHDREIQVKKNEAEKIAKEISFEDFQQISVGSSIYIHNITYEKKSDDTWKSNYGSSSDKEVFDELKEEVKHMWPSILFFLSH